MSAYLPRPNFRFSTALFQALGGASTDTTAFVNAVPANVPCILILDPKLATEEKVFVTAKTTNSVTVTRGYGGTTAQAHGLGASVVDYTTNEYLTVFAALFEAEHLSDGTHDPTHVATPTGTQTLTNKTLTDGTNNVTAKSLKSATATVDVSGATAPTVGQVLTATDTTHATWQAVPSSGGGGPTITKTRVTMSADQAITNNATNIIAFDTETFDTGNEYNTTTRRWVASGNGYAMVTVGLGYLTVPTATYYFVNIDKNGAQYYRYSPGASVGYQLSQNITALIPVSTGDYLNVDVYTGENNTIKASGNTGTSVLSVLGFY